MPDVVELRDLDFGETDVAYCAQGGWSSVKMPSFQSPRRVVWEHRGVGVLVLSRPTDMVVLVGMATRREEAEGRIPLPLLGRGGVVAVLARAVAEEDLERIVPVYVRIAARILELRDGGWRVRSVERVRTGNGVDWEQRFELIDPNDDRIHLVLPGTGLLHLRRPTRRRRLKRVEESLARLHSLPDVPQGAPTGQLARFERLEAAAAATAEVGLDARRRIALSRALRESDDPIESVVERVLAELPEPNAVMTETSEGPSEALDTVPVVH